MNTIMGLSRASCKGCYKCIRSCPVKSLSCRDEQVRVVDGECIYCGRCLLICPQNAKYIRNDLEKVQDAIAAGEKVYASVDPSCLAAFPGTDMGKIAAALGALGFVHAEPVTVGAAQVTRAYDDASVSWQAPNLITTACPSIYLLVQRHYPQLVEQLAPTVSFAAAHARIIRQIYGPRARVVSIGPCIAQKYDAHDAENGNALFAALTFRELAAWFKSAGVSPQTMKGRPVGTMAEEYYARPGGVIHHLAKETRRKWECVAVDGVSRCAEVLDSICRDNLSGYLLELTACAGGCLGGPILRMMNVPYLTAKDALVHTTRPAPTGPRLLTQGVEANLGRSFRKLAPRRSAINEEEIAAVLARMGKTSVKQELNCGCCGYSTCREKAIAVIHGKADVSMCVPYMRELAESMSATVVENIPTGVLILNERLQIEHINPAAVTLLHVKGEVCGKSVGALLPNNDFYQVLNTGENILHHKVRYENPEIVVSQSVVCVQSAQTVIVLLDDITHGELESEKHRRMTEETAQFAREVVDKQMRVVQQIAGLLGETATETKLALSKLTSTLVEQAGDGHDGQR
ncbi:MAG: [Fe-Fe] hydrogenase large subunit C-terminal domain-containing protein [Ethanoligenens sp.]